MFTTRPRSMGAADLAELQALQDLASLSLRGCPSLAAAGVSSLAALTALRCPTDPVESKGARVVPLMRSG